MKIFKIIRNAVLLATTSLILVIFLNTQSNVKPTLSAVLEKPQWQDNKTKIVLLYTDFFMGRWYLRWNKYYPCRFNCIFTYKKHHMDKADALGFHDADMPARLPKRTNFNQIWFYFNLESPLHSKAKDYQSVFNWTMSYRTESDVYAPYGDFSPLDCQETSVAQKEIGGRDFSRGKNRLVGWVASNCNDDVGRFEYVTKLASFIEVDIFGKCGQLNCTRGTYSRYSDDCKAKLKQYKFYLAFENTRCVDYITEKYWEIGIENEIVPVVMGGADYRRIAIPGSFIDVNEFDSVKTLADYLLYLNQNHTAYNEYFRWKTLFKVDTPFRYGCALCTALHSNKAQDTKVYPSLYSFWSRDKCQGKIIVK